MPIEAATWVDDGRGEGGGEESRQDAQLGAARSGTENGGDGDTTDTGPTSSQEQDAGEGGPASGCEEESRMEDVMCRYCLEGAPIDELFYPCQCTTPVHTGCLRRWLTGGDREARRLQCELCKAPIAAKLSLAPYTVIFFDRGGRNILLTTILRLAYRLFLFRRLYMRYRPVLKRWRGICSRKDPLEDNIRGFFERASLYRDSLLGMLLGWLCYLMLSRDLKSFFRAMARLRAKKASLEFVCAGSQQKASRGGESADAQDAEDALHQSVAVREVAPASRSATVDLHGSFRTMLAPMWSFANAHVSSGQPGAALRLSLGLEISHAEMALGMR